MELPGMINRRSSNISVRQSKGNQVNSIAFLTKSLNLR